MLDSQPTTIPTHWLPWERCQMHERYILSWTANLPPFPLTGCLGKDVKRMKRTARAGQPTYHHSHSLAALGKMSNARKVQPELDSQPTTIPTHWLPWERCQTHERYSQSWTANLPPFPLTGCLGKARIYNNGQRPDPASATDISMSVGQVCIFHHSLK